MAQRLTSCGMVLIQFDISAIAELLYCFVKFTIGTGNFQRYA